MLHFIAQSPPPIDSVPAEFVKNAIILGGFAFVIGLQVYSIFFKAHKREISGRVINEALPEFADADDVEKLQEDATEIGALITEMQQSFASSLHELGTKTLETMGDIKAMAAKHEALISQMERRLTSLESSHNDAVTRLHARIDDAMKRK